MSAIENRQQPRANLELRVEYKKMNTFFADYTRNISKGGTFIVTPTPLPVGTRFQFNLVIPHFNDPFMILGEVAWVLDTEAATKSSAQPGMGIRFIFESAEDQSMFTTAVETLMVEALGADISSQLLGKKA